MKSVTIRIGGGWENTFKCLLINNKKVPLSVTDQKQKASGFNTDKNISRQTKGQIQTKQTATFTLSQKRMAHNQIKATLVCLQHKLKYQYQVNPICLAPLLWGKESRWVGERFLFSVIIKLNKCQSFTRILRRHFFFLCNTVVKMPPLWLLQRPQGISWTKAISGLHPRIQYLLGIYVLLSLKKYPPPSRLSWHSSIIFTHLPLDYLVLSIHFSKGVTVL